MLILPADQHVQVDTTPPDARRDLKKGLEEKILREIFDHEHLRRPIRLGTVGFQVASGMVVHLDDVKITGPEIPNIGSPQSVNPEARLATTWGEIKNLSRK